MSTLLNQLLIASIHYNHNFNIPIVTVQVSQYWLWARH